MTSTRELLKGIVSLIVMKSDNPIVFDYPEHKFQIVINTKKHDESRNVIRFKNTIGDYFYREIGATRNFINTPITERIIKDVCLQIRTQQNISEEHLREIFEEVLLVVM